MVLLFGITSAAVGQVAGSLNYTFTQVGQPITHTWTLANSGNEPESFLISYTASNSFKLQTNVANGIIPPNSEFPISIKINGISGNNFNGLLSASFTSNGNLLTVINKNFYITYAHESMTIIAIDKISSTTTS